MMSLRITVVLPVYNEAAILSNCLTALHAQTVPPDEILIVDNNSTDDSVAIARTFPGVQVITEPKQGITHARTAGFDAAKGDIIARIDADTTVAPDWIEVMHNKFLDPTVDGITGLAGIAELSPKNKIWFTWYYSLFRWWHQRSIGLGPVLYGFNSAIRATAWQNLRPYLTDGDHMISEDLDVTLGLLVEQRHLFYEPSLRVKCRLLRSFDIQKIRRYYRTDGLTLKKYKLGNKRRWQ